MFLLLTAICILLGRAQYSALVYSNMLYYVSYRLFIVLCRMSLCISAYVVDFISLDGLIALRYLTLIVSGPIFIEFFFFVLWSIWLPTLKGLIAFYSFFVKFVLASIGSCYVREDLFYMFCVVNLRVCIVLPIRIICIS